MCLDPDVIPLPVLYPILFKLYLFSGRGQNIFLSSRFSYFFLCLTLPCPVIPGSQTPLFPKAKCPAPPSATLQINPPVVCDHQSLDPSSGPASNHKLKKVLSAGEGSLLSTQHVWPCELIEDRPVYRTFIYLLPLWGQSPTQHRLSWEGGSLLTSEIVVCGAHSLWLFSVMGSLTWDCPSLGKAFLLSQATHSFLLLLQLYIFPP